MFSLPSECGIGCFSKEAYTFIDKLAEAGQKYWQILPIGHTGGWYSPYQPLSCFAVDPMFIDPLTLRDKGLLSDPDISELSLIRNLKAADPQRVDYESLLPVREKALRKAFAAFMDGSGAADNGVSKKDQFDSFCKENASWLDDYAMFCAFSVYFRTKDWSLWSDGIRMREKDSLKQLKDSQKENILFFKWAQFEAYREWMKIVEHAHSKGVEIIGDIPIYAAYESADCWAEPRLFQLGDDLLPNAVAGCPPDAFAPEGQIWGNPLYTWKQHRKTGYDWWIRRLRQDFKLYDVIRLDHMRGFEAYFSIPADSETALTGEWEKGPGMSFFRAVRSKLPGARFIAEDLGYITPKVNRLIKRTGLPGMKVLQFAFDSDGANPYLPENITEHCVIYTGTHDNDTTKGWYLSLDAQKKKHITAYLRKWAGADSGKSAKAPEFGSAQAAVALVNLAFMSRADTCIVPMQDFLMAGTEARINTPGTVGENWRWRMKKGDFTVELASYISELTKETDRLPR